MGLPAANADVARKNPPVGRRATPRRSASAHADKPVSSNAGRLSAANGKGGADAVWKKSDEAIGEENHRGHAQTIGRARRESGGVEDDADCEQHAAMMPLSFPYSAEILPKTLSTNR